MRGKTHRNPALRWAEPVQGQGARQQARFLMQIEEAMAADQRFRAEHSLVLNQQTRAVLGAGGVPLELGRIPGEPGYAKAITAALKAPWVEAKGHPLLGQLNATKDSVSRCLACAGALEYMEQNCSTASLYEATLGHHNAELLEGWEPKLRPLLNWRHQLHCIVATVLEQGLPAAGLQFDLASLAELQQLAEQATALIEARREAILAERKAEYRERFGHQPANDGDHAWFSEMAYIAYGKTYRQVVEEILGGGAYRPSGNNEPPTPTDWTTLGLKPGAAVAEIKAAFRALAKEHHPDVGGNTQQFIALAAAAERLLGRALR